ISNQTAFPARRSSDLKFLPESKRNIPTPLVSIKKILGFTKGYYASKVGETETAQVDILVGAFMLMKRSLYEQISGFDEDYFMYGDRKSTRLNSSHVKN